AREGAHFVVVVGGGKPARTYLEAARNLGADNEIQDLLGIRITRANALLFAQALENAHAEIITSAAEVKAVLDSGKIPVLGGLKPGITTDGVAALVTEALCEGTRTKPIFINLTNVAGVYTADPRKDKKAKLLERLSYAELIRIVSAAEQRPGQNIVLDLPCCRTLEKNKIRTFVLDGNDLPNFKHAVRGEKFKGTVIGG
ncbi:UMP kinase, partial [Candidatus Micrarchaeota archaeon]|nr:UMP kinase [Candidatus Micrarchaeota archaeon]